MKKTLPKITLKRANWSQLWEKTKLSQRQYLLVLLGFLIVFIPVLLVVSFARTPAGKTTFNSVTDNAPAVITDNFVASADAYKLLFVGDMMFARSIGTQVTKGADPFQHVAEKFKEYDLVVGNLETSVARPGIGTANPIKLFTFKSPVKALELLAKHNVGVVSLANNHSMDYGVAAMEDALRLIPEHGLIALGAGRNLDEAFEPKYVVKEGLKLAFLAFNSIENWANDAKVNRPGAAMFDEGRIRTSIQKAAANSDLVIVFPHWGSEYNPTPNGTQEKFAKIFIESGADLVVGTHAHTVQPSTEVNGKPVFYGLGNFIFDGMSNQPGGTDAEMVEVVIQNKQIVSTKKIGVKIDSVGFPRLK